MRMLALAVLMLAEALPGPTYGQQFKCGGTEPFWNLDIGEHAINDSVSLGSSFKLEARKPDSARGAAEDYVLVYRTHTVGARDEPVAIVLQKSLESKCSNGMSDAIYPFYVVLITRRNVLTGCCERK